MMQMWTDLTRKMMQAAAAFSPTATPLDASRQMRSTMLDAWARSWDQFLRAPMFLEMMKNSMAGAVEWQRQVNDMLAETQHRFQGASRQDVDQLMQALQHLEQRVVSIAEKVDARLDEMAARLNGEESHGCDSEEDHSPAGRHAPSASARANRKTSPPKKKAS
jgi:hypothetical protein